MKNAIKTVDNYEVIKLSDYQASEIERVIATLKAEGKDALRITPYYASLMHEDPFNPVMLPDEKTEKRLDPIAKAYSPANLLFQIPA